MIYVSFLGSFNTSCFHDGMAISWDGFATYAKVWFSWRRGLTTRVVV